MSVYCFTCKNKKCNLDYFEILCKYEEIEQTICPSCGSKKIEKLLTTPNFMFAQPQTTSKFDNFSYRAGFNMEKAKEERRRAEAAGQNSSPYSQIDDIHQGEGISDNESQIILE